jgi:hypothetical protein
MAWGLLSLFFWLPLFRNKPLISLLHSLVFFGLVARDIFFNPGKDSSLVKNNMKLYTDSLLLQSACFITILLIYFLVNVNKKKSDP